MDFFLRAKHWQLFVLAFGLPFLLSTIFMGSIIFQVISHQEQGPVFINRTIFSVFFFFIFPVLMLLFIGIQLSWQWAIAIRFQKMLPEYLKSKTGLFKVFIIFSVVYIIVTLMFVVWGIKQTSASPDGISSGLDIAIVVIFPVHLFFMFCLFYCLYFVAKTIKVAELKHQVSFGDFAGEFFMTWFFPVGIWILQPRINKMFREYTEQAAITA